MVTGPGWPGPSAPRHCKDTELMGAITQALIDAIKLLGPFVVFLQLVGTLGASNDLNLVYSEEAKGPL